MSFVIDAVLVVLLVFFAVRHYKLGLACSVLSAGKLLFSLLLAAVLRRTVGSILMLVMKNAELPYSSVEITSGVLGFIVVFILAFILSGVVIRMISRIKIPLITRLDKLLGLVLGLTLGILVCAAVSAVIYSLLAVYGQIYPESGAVALYDGSCVFRFIYGLKIFDFLRSLI